MNKPPAFQFYAADFLVDAAVKLMSLEARGAYVTMLAHSWIEGPLPADLPRLAQLCGVRPAVMERLWPALKSCWRSTRKPGLIVNPRLEKERQKQAVFRKSQSDKGKASGRSRASVEPEVNRGSTEPEPSSSSSSSSPSSKSKTKPSAPKAPRETWLSPFVEAWTVTYGGDPNCGELARYLKPLTGAHVPGEVLDHWTRYLAATEARFASPARFAQTYGSWVKPDRSRQTAVSDMYLTLEEQETRRARARKVHDARGELGILTDIASGES